MRAITREDPVVRCAVDGRDRAPHRAAHRADPLRRHTSHQALPSTLADALTEELRRIHTYPHGGYPELERAIADYAGVSPENVAPGASRAGQPGRVLAKGRAARSAAARGAGGGPRVAVHALARFFVWPFAYDKTQDEITQYEAILLKKIPPGDVTVGPQGHQGWRAGILPDAAGHTSSLATSFGQT